MANIQAEGTYNYPSPDQRIIPDRDEESLTLTIPIAFGITAWSWRRDTPTRDNEDTYGFCKKVE